MCAVPEGANSNPISSVFGGGGGSSMELSPEISQTIPSHSPSEPLLEHSVQPAGPPAPNLPETNNLSPLLVDDSERDSDLDDKYE
jgi:hypothetical protein